MIITYHKNKVTQTSSNAAKAFASPSHLYKQKPSAKAVDVVTQLVTAETAINGGLPGYANVNLRIGKNMIVSAVPATQTQAGELFIDVKDDNSYTIIAEGADSTDGVTVVGNNTTILCGSESSTSTTTAFGNRTVKLAGIPIVGEVTTVFAADNVQGTSGVGYTLIDLATSLIGGQATVMYQGIAYTSNIALRAHEKISLLCVQIGESGVTPTLFIVESISGQPIFDLDTI